MSGHDIAVTLAFILIVALIAGTVAAVQGLPKKWVEGWLDNRFKVKQDELNRAHQEKLGQLNHEYQTKLEGVRSEIQRTFSRVSKVHEQEYKVLPQAWFHLQKAFGTSFRTINGIAQAIRFREMTEAELGEFLATQPFSATQKKQIKDGTTPDDRENIYYGVVQSVAIDHMNESQRVFRNFLLQNSVLMSKDVYEALNAVSLKLIDANTKFVSTSEVLKLDASTKINELQPEIDALLATIQHRLYVENA
jgi:hypothetical protein